jgi:hypothetical protein
MIMILISIISHLAMKAPNNPQPSHIDSQGHHENHT